MRKSSKICADMKPIFIGGCRRSGTTMLGSMLGAGLDGLCIPEAQFIINIYKQFAVIADDQADTKDILSWWRKDKRFRLWRLDCKALDIDIASNHDRYSELIKKLVLKYGEAQGKRPPLYWVDHTPTNIKNASMLIDIFPDARFIHIVRDGRAVASSLFDTIWGPKTIHTAAYYWLNELIYGLAAEVRYGSERIKRVRYEDILCAPVTILKELCSFCGIDFQTKMAEGGDFKPPFGSTDQHRLVGQPPDTKRIHSWQFTMSKRQVEIFESIAGEVLDNMGYQTTYWPYTKSVRGIERYLLDLRELFHRELLSRIKMLHRFKRELAKYPNF